MADVITHSVIQGGGGDYPTVAAWQIAQARDLVAADEIARCEISGSWASPEAQLTITGWGTDPTRYIEIEALGAARHNGIWTSTAHRFLGTSFPGLNITEPYTNLIGLQAERVSASAVISGSFRASVGADDTQFKDCICKFGGSVASAQIAGFYLATQDATPTRPYCINCLAIHEGTNGTSILGFATLNRDWEGEFINCTVVNAMDYGFWLSATKNVCINCFSDGAVVADFLGGGGTGASNNASSDGSGVGTAPRLNQIFTFVGGDDYHLAPDDAGARTHGLNVSGTYGFSDDIDGQTRVAPWDIGADQVIVSGGGGLLNDVLTIQELLEILG